MSKKNCIKRESREVIKQTLKDQYMRLYAPTQFQSGIAFPPERVLDDTVEVPLELPAAHPEQVRQMRDLTVEYIAGQAARDYADSLIFGLFTAQHTVYEDDARFVRTGGPDARHMVIDVTAELIEPNKQANEPKQISDGFIRTIKEEEDGNS